MTNLSKEFDVLSTFQKSECGSLGHTQINDKSNTHNFLNGIKKCKSGSSEKSCPLNLVKSVAEVKIQMIIPSRILSKGSKSTP